jgi:protein O-GlcNAc transferase
MKRRDSRPSDVRRRSNRPATRETTSAGNALHQGVQFLQQNQLIRARECFERAMLANPRDAVARNCLGIVARSERRIAEAMAFFHKAIELHPEFAEAHNNMGNAHRDRGNIEQAAECYQRALKINPQFAEGHNNLGVALLASGDLTKAIESFEEAIRIQPVYAEAHNNVANAYHQCGDLIAAAASLATALELKPDSPEIHNNLANVLRETGQLDSAQQHYRQALRLKPDFVEAQENLGTVLMDLGHAEEAVAAYERAESLRPSSAASLLNLGNAYRLVGRIEEARAMYRRAAFIEPENFWHRLRIESLCPPAFRSCIEAATHRKRALESWQKLAEQRRELGLLHLDSRLAEPAFAWQFLEGNLRPMKEAYANIFGDGWPRHVAGLQNDRPRLGIVVTNGHEGIFLRSLGGILQRVNCSQFEIVIVCPNSSEATMRRALGRDLNCVPISPDFHQAADAIRAARCSALYFWEIGTDATNYFLPFLQLAPVQCTSWGVQVTSGIRQIDFYLASQLVEPSNAAEHYTEQVLFSPTLLTYQVPPRLPRPAKLREDFGFNAQQHLYVCAQQLGKFHPDFDQLIGGILRSDGRGVFVAVNDHFNAATKLVRSRLAESLPDVVDRVVFLPRLEFADYLQLLNVADVLLDPPHFGGVNSTYDALAVGQPVITLPSKYHRGRYTAACLQRAGMTGTTADDSEDYVRLAVSLANDRHRSDLRQEIQKKSVALFYDEQAVREHERLFELLIQEALSRSQAPPGNARPRGSAS